MSLTCSILLFIILKSARSKIHYVWALFNVAVAVWGIGSFFLFKNNTFGNTLFWLRFAHAGVIFIAVFFFHLVYLICELSSKRLLKFCYLQGIIFFILNFTDYFVVPQSVTLFYNSFYFDKVNNFTVPIFFVIWLFFILYGHYALLRTYLASSEYRKNQILYFFLGMITGFAGGITNFFPTFGIPVYPIGNFTIPIYCVIVTYAILKFQILDIKVAVTRTGVFLAVYTLVLGLPFAFTFYSKPWLIKLSGDNWWIISLFSMALLASAGPFFFIKLQQKAENRLLREQRRYQDTLKNAAIGMTRIRNLPKLLSLITHIVTKTVRISFSGIYLHEKITGEYMLKSSRGRSNLILALPSDYPVISFLLRKKQAIVFDELKLYFNDSKDYMHLEKSLSALNAAVIVPSLVEDRLIGFMVLGPKVSGQIYSADDLSIFQVLASQAALAIENAQFYEEAKEMQAQIAQAEKMATVGTMADGLSHQINNRFYALSLISGDLMDTIKLTDFSACSQEIQEVIRQMNSGLERIQTNVIQGGEVVNGMLKYTRKGEEGFEALTLDRIIDETLAMVQYKVKLSEIDIVRDYSKDALKIKGNLVQLVEVFFNFIDNAYDAMVERKNTLKEAGYKGRITISTIEKGDSLEITFQDNGMGIKKEDIKKIFTPFFTTKVSSRRGTGLGLYVIRNIITDMHQGKLAFDSEYKSGTRFILELPIAKQ